jgi:hypothetical protein
VFLIIIKEICDISEKGQCSHVHSVVSVVIVGAVVTNGCKCGSLYTCENPIHKNITEADTNVMKSNE